MVFLVDGQNLDAKLSSYLILFWKWSVSVTVIDLSVLLADILISFDVYSIDFEINKNLDNIITFSDHDPKVFQLLKCLNSP